MPIVIELVVLSLLSICWLGFHANVTTNLTGDIYHVASDKRDARRAKFYYASVWVGLIAAFLSARSMEAFSALSFDSATQRSWVLGSLRGMEMWGLLIVGAVWIRVGQRVSRPNSDGASLIPAAEPRRNTDSESLNGRRKP